MVKEKEERSFSGSDSTFNIQHSAFSIQHSTFSRLGPVELRDLPYQLSRHRLSSRA